MINSCHKCNTIGCLCRSQRRKKLWLGGLSDAMSEYDVQNLFPSFAEVEIRLHQFQNGQGYAFVTFENEETAKKEFENFNIRQSKSCNLKCRLCVWSKKEDINKDDNTEKDGIIVPLECEKDGMPSLSAQLSPLSETEIRKRLETLGNPSSQNQEKVAYETGGRIGKKQYLLKKLEHLYRIGVVKRNLIYLSGVGKPIRTELTQAILSELRHDIIWGKQKKKSRKGVDSECYMVLGKKAKDAPFQIKKHHERLWELAMACLKEALGGSDNSYSCTSLAVTKYFRGSPHLDRMDTTYQFAASFGDADGELCIEREGQHEICIISTRNKVVKVDGRFIHWVKDYTGKERFSLIWFNLDLEARTEPKRAVYEDFAP
mmetsp:Transcript_2590/g.3827  ORF Transcript_2590/g.3827 Transcript_2590/m.3827 type:complete len:373 (+) Transcript_2590:127-1245(+)